MKQIGKWILAVTTVLMTSQALATKERIVESCVSTTDLTWYVKVSANEDGTYKITNYKQIEISIKPGQEAYKTVYSRSANVSTEVHRGATQYGAEFEDIQLRINAAPGVKGDALKASLAITSLEHEGYDLFDYICSRN